MVKNPLERKWLHIHIFKGELYVFTDDGHWKDTEGPGGREDWEAATETTFEALQQECYVGGVNGKGELLVRILMNPTVRYGKFGMPYVEEA